MCPVVKSSVDIPAKWVRSKLNGGDTIIAIQYDDKIHTIFELCDSVAVEYYGPAARRDTEVEFV